MSPRKEPMGREEFRERAKLPPGPLAVGGGGRVATSGKKKKKKSAHGRLQSLIGARAPGKRECGGKNGRYQGRGGFSKGPGGGTERKKNGKKKPPRVSKRILAEKRSCAELGDRLFTPVCVTKEKNLYGSDKGGKPEKPFRHQYPDELLGGNASGGGGKKNSMFRHLFPSIR